MGVPYAEVIGDPIAHSKSPLIHKFWLEKLGIEGDYRRCLVRRGELAGYFEARRRDPDWRGCNITMPHKLAALEHVHLHHDPSFPVEAVNLALPGKARMEGVNADTPGFLEPLLALQAGRQGPAGAAIVIGAGGVLYSVMWSLAALGYAPIWIVMRDPVKAVRIAEDYRGVHARTQTFSEPLPPARLLVNASPLGMTGFPPFPLSLEAMERDAIVYDLVYEPLETELLRAARIREFRTLDGLAMLIPQAAVSFTRFFGAQPPRTLDGELRELLTK